MQLVIMRHGRTRANERRLYAGMRTDEPLTAAGRADCRACGEFADVKCVYVSPMLRAKETARICFPQARQVEVDDLREMDFGVFEGRSAAQMENDAQYRVWVESWCTTSCPGGEDREGFSARIAHAVAEVLADARGRDDECVVICAHGGTILSAMDAFADEKRAYFDWHVGNASGYSVKVSFAADGRPHFGDISAFGAQESSR